MVLTARKRKADAIQVSDGGIEALHGPPGTRFGARSMPCTIRRTDNEQLSRKQTFFLGAAVAPEAPALGRRPVTGPAVPQAALRTRNAPTDGRVGDR